MTEPPAALAWSFLQGLCLGGDLDEAFGRLSDDFVYWSNVSRSESDKSQLRAASVRRKAFVEITLQLVRAMVDGDEVMIEAAGDGSTRNGDRYNSTYVYLFTIRDGQVTSMREYCDTKLVADVFRSARRPLSPAGSVRSSQG